MLKKWFYFLDLVHKAMQKAGLQRVETPTLTDCIGMEPDLEFFETEYLSPLSNSRKKLFLSPSPEMNMKRLLCQGWTDIYEIKKCFRNREHGPLNSIEFSMLEWYRTQANLSHIIKDLHFLMRFLSQKLLAKPLPPLKQISMKELFWQSLGHKLKPHSSKKDLRACLHKHSIPFNKAQDISDLFNLVFLNKIEPFLDPKIPLIIYDYPPFQKAYARLNKAGWAMRFELFWQGMELANAFDEVCDLKEQKACFKAEKLKRKKVGKPSPPYPYKLLKDMETKGMPPSAGVALGLDRLFLCFTGLTDIKQIRGW